MNEELKELIDQARGNLSMADFAEKCDLSPTTLYRWLRGHQKSAMRKDIMYKIYQAAEPDSGVTEDKLYKASLQSIEGKSKDRFTRHLEIDEMNSLMCNCAREMFLKKGCSVRELPREEIMYAYGLSIDDTFNCLFDLHASPEGSFHHGETVAWWANAVMLSVGHLYVWNNLPDSRTWLHVVIATNNSEETEILSDLLSGTHYKSEMPLSIIIMDSKRKCFIAEYEMGAKKEDFFRQKRG